MKNETKIVEKE